MLPMATAMAIRVHTDSITVHMEGTLDISSTANKLGWLAPPQPQVPPPESPATSRLRLLRMGPTALQKTELGQSPARGGKAQRKSPAGTIRSNNKALSSSKARRTGSSSIRMGTGRTDTRNRVMGIRAMATVSTNNMDSKLHKANRGKRGLVKLNKTRKKMMLQLNKDPTQLLVCILQVDSQGTHKHQEQDRPCQLQAMPLLELLHLGQLLQELAEECQGSRDQWKVLLVQSRQIRSRKCKTDRKRLGDLIMASSVSNKDTAFMSVLLQ
mmetsp:Transcript_2750/g.6358  ORF Transcript_2750/g.6358 Transcript_2750/m.6358 type:complete len:269 (-) Transcript_2750:176-982(-)